MFFSANSALGPPYHILLDTNFINFRRALARARAVSRRSHFCSIQNKLDVMQAAMDCLYAKCTIYIRFGACPRPPPPPLTFCPAAAIA